MITFRQYLEERSMSATELEKVATRHANTAKIGFEFEFALPPGHRLISAESNEMRDTATLDEFDDMEELLHALGAARRDFSSFNSAYNDWKEEAQNLWVDENWNAYNENDEDEGRSEALDYYERREAEGMTELEFVKSEYGSRLEMLAHFGVSPDHGWSDERNNDRSAFYTSQASEDDEKFTHELVAKELHSDLGVDIVVPAIEPHEPSTQWMVVPDGSISGGSGVEVVSPPLPLKEGLEKLAEMFAWMKSQYVITNASTGFHINVSTPNLSNLDPVKLIVFLGEKHVLTQFNRVLNTYTSQQSERIINSVGSSGKMPKEAQALIDLAKSVLSNQKYSSVNLSKLAHGYLEFRIVGNENYHKRLNEVRSASLRFVSALEVACDPDAERKLYLKKLAAMMDLGTTRDHNDDFDNRPITDILDMASENNLPYDQMMEMAKKGNVTAVQRGKAVNFIINILMEQLHSSFVSLGIKHPSARHRAELKLLLKRLGVTTDDLHAVADRPESTLNLRWFFAEK
jgi:hypothetical protein